MLYVRAYEANVPTFLLSYVFPNWDLEKMDELQISSDESMEEIDARNKIMLDNSINSAKYVAYKNANKTVEISSAKIYVVGSKSVYNYLKEAYTASGLRAFDFDFMSGVYEKPFEVVWLENDEIPEQKNASIRVEATDRFGRTYVQTQIIGDYDYSLMDKR